MAGGITAGAAVGTQVLPGWGTAAGALIGGAMDMFGSSGAAASPAGPSILDAYTNQSFDFGQWTVATGGGNADAVNDKLTPNSAAGIGTGQMSEYLIFAMAALLALAAVKVMRK